VQLRAAHIPGIYNVNADMLSSQTQVYLTVWCLESKVFTKISEISNFAPQIDVFATSLTTKLPIYFSPVPDDNAAGLDAFQQSWNGWDVYLFPSFPLLSQVVQKLGASTNVSASLIYPHQPRKNWYPALRSLLQPPSTRIPLSTTNLQQPHNKATHPALQSLNLHAALYRSPRS
jgi:hypothetical protein